MAETNPGTLLAGKYRVERVLGTGGMGVVVAAIHEALDERVAIKLLRAERLAQADAVERALREARATVKIQSDHVVRVFDVGTLESGAPYIVMEYLAGCDLAQLLCAEGRLDIADAAAYVKQACDAVAKAHAIGIVHRDLKPANLFLAVRDDIAAIKVLDFGISKFVSTDARRVNPALTNTASVLGSPAYMSPEQLESPRDVDGRTDVWSLGVILFELLTGAHPFVADTLPQLYRKIAEQPAPSVRSLRPDVPPDLDAIVARCLAKDPAERIGDVAALALALAPHALDAAEHRKIVGLAETACATGESAEALQSARLASKISGVEPARVRGAAESAAVPPRRRRKLAFGAFAIAGFAAAATSTLVCVRADDGSHAAPAGAPPVAAAPLAAPNSILACPPLVAKGVDQPAGWLGAATATIACTRAMARMGGHSGRTLIPAKLLDLPATLVDNFPNDAFGSAAARPNAVAAARTRGTAWIDGEVDHTGDQFAISLVLRAGDRELARGTGKAPTLVGAVRDAMQPLDALIPPAADDDAFLREWYGVRTADAAADLVDWGVQQRLEWPAKVECEHALADRDVLPSARGVVALYCAPDAPGNANRDTSSAGALALSIEADGTESTRPIAADLALLDAQLAKTTDHDARAMLLGVEASVYSEHRDFDGATRSAVQALKEGVDVFTPFTGAWNVLSWVRADSNAAPAATAWTPWNTEAYCFSAMRDPLGMSGVKYMRRNTVLSHHPIWKQALVEFLLADGKRDEALGITATLPNDPTVAITEASVGHFTRALEAGHALMTTGKPDDAVYAAWFVTEIDRMLGRKTTGIDELVARVLDPKDNPIGGDVPNEINLAMACTNAPAAVAAHCFARLREITGGVVFFEPHFLDGAEKFAAGDLPGAARMWRPIAAARDWHFVFMHDVLAIAFDGAADPSNASRIDASYVDHGQTFNGAEPAHAREALRAEKRGDVTRARELAQKVIDAWSVADIDVPAVAEMRKLVARLDGRAREQRDHTR